MSITALFFILGWLLCAFGFIMFIPAFISAFTSHMAVTSFVFSALSSIFVGGALVLMNKTKDLSLRHKDAFLLTFLTWVMISFFGALPFYLSGITPSFIDAFFESVSGLTTTGATILSGLDHMDKGILFWRAMLQWLGGMGVIVLATAILPFLGVGGLQLYKAEMPGVVKDKLQPRLKETAEILWIVYFILTSACTLAYYLAGMSFFDAICHAFTTLSTGGYSTYDASLGYFNSALIEGIAIVFMALGGMNFALHFILLSRRRFHVYFKDSEVISFISVICIITGIMAFSIYSDNIYNTLPEAIRYALFNTVSAITTTGFGTADYAQWPTHVLILFVFMMFLGGCSGSTSGGIKIMRVMLVSRFGWREMLKTIHPRAVLPLKVSGHVIPSNIIQSVWGFVGLYIICFVLITILLGLCNLDLVSSFSAAAATLSSLGPALGTLGPAENYGGISDMAKSILCFSMLLGRLELITLLIIFTPQFWRK